MSWARYTVAIPPRPSRPMISYSPIVARRRDSMTPLSRGASILAVAKAVCCPEISEPQLGQYRAPACIAWPQRGQLVVWVVTEALIYAWRVSLGIGTLPRLWP